MTNPMNRVEFVALIAMMFATIAFSIDSMLPALPKIAGELSPTDPNRAQLILTSFVLGMGIGTLFTGPISDAIGRRPVMLGGAAIYIAASVMAWLAQSLELVLAARVLQGLGAAGPRVAAVAVVRDFYTGRLMARIMSIAMMIFTLVPAAAPLLGQQIIALTGWRGIFIAFVIFSMIGALWVIMRLPESLPKSERRPFRLPLLWDASVEMVQHPTVRLSIIVQTLCLGILFTMITNVQPVYDEIFDASESFPKWFAAVALISGTASMINAALVVRFGMRRMVTYALMMQILSTLLTMGVNLADMESAVLFGFFVFWQGVLFFTTGMTLGNLNAMGMEPMGHIAGMAASVIGALSTFGAAIIAAPLGLMFNGTIWPMAYGILTLCVAGLGLMLHMARVEAAAGLR